MPTVLGIDPLYSLSGLVIGAIVGMTGVGGGALMTPLLILFFGIHPATAVGTDLLYAATTKTAGTLVHGSNRMVDWGIVARLATGSVPAAALTLYVMAENGVKSDATGHLVSLVLGVMLVLTALSLFLRPHIARLVTRVGTPGPLRQTVLTVLFGAAIGVLVSISSVGAGAVGVTVLMLLYPRLSMLRVVGSDIAHAVPLALVAGLGHWAIGDIDWHMLLSLLVGSVPGIVVASLFAPRVSERILRLALGAVLTLVAAKLLIG